MNYNCLEKISEKTNGCCGFPGCESTYTLEVHHMIPRGRGGNSQHHNLIYLCPNHHRFNSNSVHNSNDSLIMIQQLYIKDYKLCIIDRNERIENKKHRSKINKAINEKRKAEYKKIKEQSKKPIKDKNIEKFRENLRVKKQ